MAVVMTAAIRNAAPTAIAHLAAQPAAIIQLTQTNAPPAANNATIPQKLIQNKKS